MKIMTSGNRCKTGLMNAILKFGNQSSGLFR